MKQLLIPVAAFAVSVTSVQAFSPDLLHKAGLSSEQIAAFVEARDRRMEGDREAARDVLASAGIDLDTLEEVRTVLFKEHGGGMPLVHQAILDNDYDAFKAAVEDKQAYSNITTGEEFEMLVQAHELKSAGEHDAAKEIFEELGIHAKPRLHHNHDGEARLKVHSNS